MPIKKDENKEKSKDFTLFPTQLNDLIHNNTVGTGQIPSPYTFVRVYHV